jgi:hypothetical protein
MANCTRDGGDRIGRKGSKGGARLDRRNRPGGTVDGTLQGVRVGGHEPRLTHVF